MLPSMPFSDSSFWFLWLLYWQPLSLLSWIRYNSDQGANYRSFTYRKCLAEHGVRQSFSRPRTPQDNAPLESFFASFKREELYRIRYRSVRDFFSSVDRYMTWYNNKRLHQNLHYKTPDAYEETFYAKKRLIVSAEWYYGGSDLSVFRCFSFAFSIFKFSSGTHVRSEMA